MALNKFTRTVVAGLLIAAVPVAATAATRPSAAIPAATSASVAQFGDDDDGWSGGWLAIAGVAIIWAIALIVMLGDDDDDRSLTRG